MTVALALSLAETIRHDGHGGVADDLADVAGLDRWLRHPARLPKDLTGIAWRPTEALRCSLVELRQAVRALCAYTVAPAPPSRMEETGTLPLPEAISRLNNATGAAPTARLLRLTPDGTLSADRSRGHAPALRLRRDIAESAVELVTGPQRMNLRACRAPRCVRYFLRDSPRQEWCKPSCGNRARAARHYRRHRKTD